ncbi:MULTISPECIES: tyrosine-type recombinase/integrase [unclassified Pseudoalteromonas]|uniref:tyrosine-type recombinase/integrase n=1 Tax=unclassified Pseudoalteromonas TaxID=194690 RepID=UPI00048AA38E|nr:MULTISPECIES: integrase arm-type DNA-binding domain-containing protein [unclassified Pseudoalteromonas]
MPIEAAEINGLKCPEDKKQIKKHDGKGLYLLIKPNGSKLWRFRYVYAGKNKEMALGQYPSIKLANARKSAEDARILLSQGIDPMAERKALKKSSEIGEKTFVVVATKWWEKQKGSWSEDHAKRIYRWLTIDSKKVCSLAVDEIDAGHITELMLDIESSGHPKKAPVILSILNRIFAFALGLRLTRHNPAQGLVLKDILSPLPKVKSFAAIVTPKELANLITDIDSTDSGTFCTAEALKLIPRVFLRPNEIRNLKWEFVDFEDKLIRIPEDLMKRDRDHLVPLSTQVLKQLEAVREVTGYSPFVFPGQHNSNNPISKNVMTNRLRSLGYGADVMTAHGFRSTASTILHEQGWESDIIETQLAHLTGTETSRAYNRAKYLSQRRKMMQEWSDYLEKLKENAVS